MASMLSLLDVLPRHEQVDIGGDKPIDIFGICAEDMGKILERYPDAFMNIMGSGMHPTRMDGGLLGALCAAAQRNGGAESLLGNESVENFARYLAIGVQVKLLAALGRCTFPDGIGPFLEIYTSMSSAQSEALEVIVKVASEDRSMISPQMRRPSAQPPTPPSGDSPPDK